MTAPAIPVPPGCKDAGALRGVSTFAQPLLALVSEQAVEHARRQGGAVQSISAEADRTALLRFYGYLERLQRVPQGADLSISFLCRTDLGDLTQGYATWLQNNQNCKFSTIANYLNGLVSITTYAYANFEPAAEVLNAERCQTCPGRRAPAARARSTACCSSRCGAGRAAKWEVPRGRTGLGSVAVQGVHPVRQHIASESRIPSLHKELMKPLVPCEPPRKKAP